MLTKKILVPILTVVMLLSQVSQIFAITPTELTSIVQESPNVLVEVYEEQQYMREKLDEIVSEDIGEMAGLADKIISGNFTDIKKADWYYQDVIRAKSLGLLAGVGQGKYAPKATITYAQYLTVMVRILDENIDSQPEGAKWYTKYINRAVELGVISAESEVKPTAVIPRQDMIKYTCKALDIKPATISKLIFSDTKTINAGYINAAFNEYLTEGTGRTTDGMRQFGYDKTSTRAELATMLLRVKDYKENPTEYKAEKAVQRAAEEKRYEEEQEKYVIENGYKIRKADYQIFEHGEEASGNEGSTTVFDLRLCVDYEYPRFKEAARIAIASKHGEEIAKQIYDYGNTKTGEYVDIEKIFTTKDGYKIYVRSLGGDPYINITVVQPKK